MIKQKDTIDTFMEKNNIDINKILEGVKYNSIRERELLDKENNDEHESFLLRYEEEHIYHREDSKKLTATPVEYLEFLTGINKENPVTAQDILELADKDELNKIQIDKLDLENTDAVDMLKKLEAQNIKISMIDILKLCDTKKFQKVGIPSSLKNKIENIGEFYFKVKRMYQNGKLREDQIEWFNNKTCLQLEKNTVKNFIDMMAFLKQNGIDVYKMTQSDTISTLIDKNFGSKYNLEKQREIDNILNMFDEDFNIGSRLTYVINRKEEETNELSKSLKQMNLYQNVKRGDLKEIFDFLFEKIDQKKEKKVQMQENKVNKSEQTGEEH